MKCRLTKELEVAASIAPPELLAQCKQRGNFLFAPVGAIIDDPNCFFLVLQRNAEAYDEECRARTQPVLDAAFARAESSRIDIKKALAEGREPPPAILNPDEAAERLSRGIHPDDFEAYAAGKMIGYRPNGEWIPGPNWQPPQPEDDDEEAEELDE